MFSTCLLLPDDIIRAQIYVVKFKEIFYKFIMKGDFNPVLHKRRHTIGQKSR